MTSRSSHGFTLVELLLVMAIMAAVTTLFLTKVTTGTNSAELRAATREMTAALAETRSLAIAGNRVTAVVIAADARHYREPRREHLVPPRLAVAFSGVVPLAAGAGAIYFFPDGSSSGGEIDFAAGPASAAVHVDWFTGHAGAQDIRAARR
ncbi:MAG TPA: GspH/FimT family pseudopilin [Stellaceae bacterium]|nr:GspH/FimT family pseudopilin [Stellaceae bacterium]